MGDGPLRAKVEAQVKERVLSDRFVFTGTRMDVPFLLRGAMDCLLYPSLFEGLPLALVEAQAAGLPCVLSDAISTETDLIPPLLQRLPLSEAPSVWGRAVSKALSTAPVVSPDAALETVQNSSLSIQSCIASLTELYEQP